MNFKLTILHAILLSATLASTVAFATDDVDVISDVQVNLKIDARLHPLLEEKIISSVRSVGLKALSGKTVSEAENLQSSLSTVTKQIFNQVISGFVVDSLEIKPGAATYISISLTREQPLVESVEFKLQPEGGLNQGVATLFEKQLAGIVSELESDLSGIPVGSASWTAPIIKKIIEENISASGDFEEIKVSADVVLEPTAKIIVYFTPEERQVRAITIKMRSKTIPSIVLERIKFALSGQTDVMLGLPINYVDGNQEFFSQQFLGFLAEHSFAQKLRLKYEIRMYVHKHTIITVIADSQRYSAFARVKASLGKDDHNPDAEGHLGIFPVDDTEIFTEFNFLPGPIDLQFNLGVGYRYQDLYVAGGKNVIDGLDRLWVRFDLTEDIILSYERDLYEAEDEKQEGSVTFKAHDFFSIEVVSDFSKDVWLRFVANL